MNARVLAQCLSVISLFAIASLHASCGGGGNSSACSPSNPTGSCPSGQTCTNGACAATACSPSNLSGACPAGQSCLNGSCCQASSVCGSACCSAGQACIGGQCCSNPCGSQCCSSGSVCVTDTAGNKSCAQSCTSSSQCPAASPCCAVLTGGGAACVANGVVTGQQCRCATTTECASGCCAPMTDASGNPVGPYVCKPNDGQPYNCCFGTTVCGGNYCCVADSAGNQFCSLPCSSSSNCGAAHCNTYDFSHTTCSGPTACGP